ncbi:MAG: photosynthetic reaction center cytochrome c subunit [Acidobacteria bacterium]|nr:photosynthetic reaction center cytochrome c subunit [Acidobacteriota bacterium]
MKRAVPIVGLVWLAVIGVHASPAQNPPPAPAGRMAEQVFQNVQVLKGIPADEFLDTMGMFASALLFDCVSCHAKEIISDPKAFQVATPRVQRARQMVVMMNTINTQFFGGQPRVTCFTCHGGGNRPKTEPNLDLQYGEPADDPYAMAFVPSLYAPPVDQVFAKYLASVGGADQLATFTSFAATGTYAGYETEQMEVPAEVYVRAPNQMATIAKTPAGLNVRVFDGRVGWRFQPDTPLPLIELSGGNLTGAAIEAMMWFPATIQRAFAQWQVGVSAIGGRDVVAVQGTNPGQPPVRLYFDEESGRLLRLVHWRPTAVGAVPTRIDFADYRALGGIQVPFQWTRTWTNNQVVVQLNEIRPNAPIDASRFARPAI